MRRTITKTAASIGLVIAFVVGGVALGARPAAAGPTATSCIGLDIVTIKASHTETSSTSTSTSTSTSSSSTVTVANVGDVDLSDPTDTSINLKWPPDPDIQLCGPFIVIRP